MTGPHQKGEYVDFIFYFIFVYGGLYHKREGHTNYLCMSGCSYFFSVMLSFEIIASVTWVCCLDCTKSDGLDALLFTYAEWCKIWKHF